MALPSGYTQLKYIRASGSQYINTGVVATSKTTAKYKFSLETVKQYGPHILSGSLWFFPLLRALSGSTFVAHRGGNNVENAGFSAKVGVDYEVDAFTNDRVTINGTDCGSVTNGGTSSDSAALHLMSYGGSPADSNYTMNGKMYYCKIYENGSLIRDFIPAKNSAGTVGLYDAADGVFYTNAGSGAFEAGPVATGAVDGNGATIIAGVSFAIKEGKAMLNGTARKITEGMTKVNGAVKKIALAAGIDVAALAISCSGAYTDQKEVVMSGKTYRLLTITGSGTLTLPQEVVADVWLCAGGNGGAAGGRGGGGGLFSAKNKVAIDGSVVCTIGSGGSAAKVGNATAFGASSISNGSSYYNGASGGGNGGTGGGATTVPFGSSDYFSPHSAGGGGGGSSVRYTNGNTVHYLGGAGGSNGANGAASKSNSGWPSAKAAGGNLGGGAGGSYDGNSPTAGSSASYYGSGGGGGGSYENEKTESVKSGGGGAGYQGVIYVRIPYEQ